MNELVRAERGKISPYQFFFVVFVSRIVVALTYVQTITVGKLGSDFLYSVALSLALTLLFSIPALLCCKRGKAEHCGILYSAYFIWLASVNVSRFSYFVSSKVSTSSAMVVFIAIIVISAVYCAILGIEGMSRFGVFCGVLLALTIAVILAFNIHNFEKINLFPVFSNNTSGILRNALFVTSNSSEPAILLALSGKINGSRVKPFVTGMAVSYGVIFVVLLFVVGVMGANASLQTYPIFTLFQMASVGSLSRLDSLHTAIWVLALLLKASVLIYSASLCVKRYKHSAKCVVAGVVVLAVAFVINEVIGTSMVKVTMYSSLVLFLIFVVALPVISLFIGRNKGENN